MIDAAKPHPNKKKIFVFCDGTGNEFSQDPTDEGGNSNVVKLYTTLRVAEGQVAYYHPGVGTMGDSNIRWAVLRQWSKVKGLAFGNGFKANVIDAYRYLMEVYNDGDEIYIFGFSRGAYTARALGGMLHGYGLLCRGNEGHLLYVWRMFRAQLKQKRKDLKNQVSGAYKTSTHSVKRNFSFAETFSRKVTIRFMGIWDTVSSVGWIYDPIRLIDMAQNPSIQVGRHAVSIDERRAFYRDNLWGPNVGIRHPEWPDELRRQNIRQDIVQVWFPGAHSDIGGSYAQKETAPANESLRWMIGELQTQGAELCQERIDMVLGTRSEQYSADQIYTPAPKADHCLHDELKGFSLKSAGWWLLQCFPQQYYDKEDSKIQWRTPYGTPRHLPDGAIVHHSAWRRLRQTVLGQEMYRPRNLRLDHLKPLDISRSWTTANIQDCFVFKTKPGLLPEPDSTTVRKWKVFAGWLTFGLFCVVVLLVLWCLLEIVCALALPIFRFFSHAHVLRAMTHLPVALRQR